MRTVSVYRIQHRLFGTGPYRLPSHREMCLLGTHPARAEALWVLAEDITEAHTPSDGVHPLPVSDNITRMPPGYAFGFESMDSLRAWFSTKWLHRLSKHDFLLVEFDVPVGDVLYGRHQVAFNPDFSAVIKEHPLLPGVAGRVRHMVR